VADDARFCSSCGHHIAAHAEERRVVTVVFADLVGFTALSESLDPETVKRLVDRAFERLVHDIETFGGRVDKIIGDAIVALFGAPIAHEDDAERAVRSAMRMQDTLGAYAVEAGVDIQMRVGVNTGEVLVGALRAGGDYTAMGDVVNTASRIQNSAEPGTVVVGESTHLATRSVVTYTPRQTLYARGREQPVEVWRATGALRPPGYRHRRSAGPIIGRDAELAVLENSISVSVRNDRAQQILLLGEAGVGKSRLAAEISPLVKGHWPNASMLTGRCVPYGEANPWWPIADAIRDGCAIDLDEDLDSARDKLQRSVEIVLVEPESVPGVVNGLLHLLGYEGPLRGLDPSRARVEATQALLAFMEASVRVRPIVVKIADLHWADELVLDLIDNLSSQLARQPFVLVATGRRSLLRRWTPRAGRFNQLVLNIDPLERAAAEELLDLLASAALDQGLRNELLDRSGGNPFFLEELVTLTEDRGVTRSGAAELPDNLRGLMSARIDALTTEERLVLEDAAVWGSDGPIIALRRLAEAIRGATDIDDLVASLERKEVITFDGDNWAFRSDLVREVAYSRLMKSDRLKRHLGIAGYMEAAFGGRFIDDGMVETVARHYAEAARLSVEMASEPAPDDLGERALRWLVEAARRAEQSASWPLAERFLSQGLDLVQNDTTWSLRLAMLLGRAKVRCEQWNFDGARSDAHLALELGDEMDDESARAHALTRLGEISARDSQFDDAQRYLADAAGIFARLDDPQGRAEAMRWSGMAALFRNDNAAAFGPIEESLVDFRAAGDRRGEAWALQNLAWIAFTSGQVSEATARLDESAAAFREIGDSGGLAWVMGLLAFVRLFEGRFAEAREIAESVRRETSRRNDPWGQGMMNVVLGAVDLWEGRTEEAAAVAEEALASFRSIGDQVGIEQALALGGRAEVMCGRVAAGLAMLDEAMAGANSGSGVAGLGLGIVGASAVRVQLGDDALVAPVQWLLDLGATLTDDQFGQIDVIVSVALAAAQQGRFEDAESLLDRLIAADDSSGYALSVAALVAAARGDAIGATATESRVLKARRSTYLDRAMAGIAVGLSGDPAGFDRSAADVAATGDRIARAIQALAEGVAVGDTASAEDLWSELGVDPSGWRRLFDAAIRARI